MTKKVYKQNVFLCRNWQLTLRNFNYEFKSLLKNKMGLKTKTFNIFGVHWKIRFLTGREGCSWKTNIEGGLPKQGSLDSLQI